ncbi:DUF2947 domain-containing protein [Pseudoalteromonas sp. McH1-42]|uniref:DUF2947 domain-containing protein n=1 Tax=Pseudoalteromonas sp. McH1-42 TaxID=2917752 RepID=UPI001EF3F67F|nr:DUF2947 domain-containing protein [Pseudoalteromonas sp. McH1-42]MCG7563131.1 DUF2947 domain-containing protein [Pseudoalteromonas sp. McH1-42]
MNYIALDAFKKAWVFRHQDLPIDEADLARIKPMTEQRAAVLWTTMVSREQDHPDFFTPHDWPGKEENWHESLDWEGPWEAGEATLPDIICDFLNWEDNTTVYFCMSRELIIETQFDVFKRTWQNFMFLADGSLLIGKKRDTAVMFSESGEARLGKRPKTP